MEPTSFRDPSALSVRPLVRPSEATPSTSHRACPAPAYLSVCTRPCVSACVLGASLSLWMVGCSRSLVPATSSIQRAGQAGRPSFTPPILTPSLPRAPLWRKCLPTIGLRRAAACPPTAACNGRTQTVTRWQPLSLVVSQVPLRSAIWCSESDHLTRGQKSSLDDDDNATRRKPKTLCSAALRPH